MKNKQRFLGHHRLMLLEARNYLRSYYDLSLFFPANHRASRCDLECCLEGFAALDGHKSMPSREPMCPAGP